MKTRQKIAVAMIVSGVIAGLGNYLWLIGLTDRPSDDLMAARWLYEVSMLIFGGMLGWLE